MIELHSTFLIAFALIYLSCSLAQKSEVNAARLQTPIIASIAPSFGSVEGGTWLTISGANFAQQGLFTNRAVFIGGQLCKEISYYTSNTQITCVVPKCVQPECLSDPLWGGSVRVSLDVYVQGVEGIKSATSSYVYHGGYTPMILQMMRYVRNSAFFSLLGRTSTTSLDNVEIRIGDNLVSLGEPGEVNPSSLNMWTYSQNLYYLPPNDIPGGYYNLTFTAQYDADAGYVGTGNARMFARQRPLSSYSYFYRYNFDAVWSGKVFSVAVQPTIYSITPSSGSIVGGTVLTIVGAGFSLIKELNQVIAGGRECKVLTSTASTITCVTSPSQEDIVRFVSVDGSGRPSFSKEIVANSSRAYGSPGWWIRLWPLSNYYSNQMRDDNVQLSLGYRGDSLFSLYYMFGTDWNSKIGVDSQTFAAQFATHLVAPVSGDYRFVVSGDDNVFLYCRLEGQRTETTLFSNLPYTDANNVYSNLGQRLSQPVTLLAGQRLRLRALLVNVNTADYLSVGLRIDPSTAVENITQVVHGNGQVQEVDLTSPTFAHHHTLRDIQVVSLTINYQREVQTLVLANVASGTFRIILQNMVATDVLSFASTSTDISNALYYASLDIPSASRLCSSFGVSRSFANSATTMFIRVEFYCDNADPLPLLYAYTADLLPMNSNLTTYTQRNQLHTPIPSGTFKLTVPVTSPVKAIDVPFDSSPDSLRGMLQALSSDITVDVTRGGSAYSGFSWTVTFVTPRGDIPSLAVNASGVSGSNVRSRVLQAQNGSLNALWFQSIPAWMTEVPLKWATVGKVRSNVEVYVRQGTDADGVLADDVSKAACDPVYGQGDYTNATWRQLLGDESRCAFQYASAKTPLVSSYRKVDLDADRSYLEIWGSGFSPASLVSPLHQVRVSVMEHPCNVTFVNDTFITCNVHAVPWGRHLPRITVEGLGDALLLPRDELDFTQEIVSVQPSVGSFAGGQIVTIFGRGFRWNATVTFISADGSTSDCTVLSVTSTEVRCRAPPARSVYTHQPSSMPSGSPSTKPSGAPSTSPSSMPSSQPTSPTSRPSSAPSHPTPLPTFSPTCEPTHEPSALPTTEHVGVSPTREPTTFDDLIVPTLEPTSMMGDIHALSNRFVPDSPRDVVDHSAVGQPRTIWQDLDFDMASVNKARRHLSAEDDIDQRNMVQILVDGQPSSNEVITRFSYNAATTPLVVSVTPEVLSAAVSTNITIVGRHLISGLPLSSVHVSVGGQRCVGLVAEGEDVIRCLVVRNKSHGGDSVVDVIVEVDGKGYAGLASSPNVLPSIRRGFDFALASAPTGSLLGGNVLHLVGHGFLADQPSKHVVKLRQVNGPQYSDYDELLMALGFDAQTTIPAQTVLYCNVTSVSEEDIFCQLPDHADVYTDAMYDISLSLNNVTAICVGNATACQYSQNSASTPVVGSWIAVTQQDAQGEYLATVRISGVAAASDSVSVIVQGRECTVIELDSLGNLTFTTPPLSFHPADVVVFVSGFGRAQSSATFQPLTQVDDIHFASSNGSVAGGTRVTVRGRGFSEVCEENNIVFTALVSGADRRIAVDSFISCSVYELQFRTPSLLSLLPSSVVSSRLLSFVAQVISFDYRNGTVSQVISPSFAYAVSSSPIIALNASAGFAGDALLVTVKASTVMSQLSASIGDVAVRLLRVDPVSSGTTGQSITSVITAPELPASSSSYNVLVEVAPFGYAVSNESQPLRLPRFRSKFQVDALSTTVVSSVEGGLQVRVTGKGLSQDGMYLSLCYQNCTFVRSSYHEFVCETPPRVPTDAVVTLESQSLGRDTIATLNGTYFSSLNNPSSALLANAHDDDKATYFSQWSTNCFVGIQLPPDTVAQPHRMLFYPRIAYANRIRSFYFEGRLAGSKTFTTLASSSGAREGWNFLEAHNGTDRWYSAFRYRAVLGSAASSCMLAELSFSGIVAYNRSTCAATLHMPSVGRNVAIGNVQFSLSNTPIVTDIWPRNGSALGGQLVTITGEHLSPLAGASGSATILLSQVECAVQSVSASVIECITGPRPPEAVETSSIEVSIPGRGLAYVPDSVQYLYIDKWSALTTWKNQEPPVDGDVVWIPDGQVILLDEDTPLLTFLLIEGRLYFDRTKPSLHLDSHYVLILGGYMEVGTEEEPYENEAVLTLHGDRYKSVDIPMIGVKFICVANRGLPKLELNPGRHVPDRDNGQLEVHGKKRLRTWTHIENTIVAGSNYLITSEPVDFAPGEQVVVTGSEAPNGSNNPDAYGLEVMTVLRNVDGYNITFTTAFRNTHRSEIVFIEGRRIDLRMEVGLLTRNVKIQGDEEKSDGQLLGVHNMAVMSGIFRIENAEVRRCGQAFRFGRYCTHSHMAGNMEGSYVKANSIHNSYQRAVTTHDTSYWEVRDNVAFNVMGHAFFVEDGPEFHNAITGNLGVFILTSSALLHSDLEPSIFWTRGPFNMWRDNAAAHSAGNGFWFELGNEDEYCLIHTGLQEFVNNTFHSNTVFGLKIYPEWTPLQDPCDEDSAPLHVYLYNMLSYRNAGNGMFSKKHGAIHHVSPTFVENPGGDVSIVKYPHNEYNNDPTFRDALFVGSIDPNFQSSWSSGHYGIWTPQGEFFYVSNTTFVNYGGSGVITGCNSCLNGDEMNQGGFTTRFDRLRFVRSTKRLFWSPTKKEILWDLDGSLAGVADSMITMFYGHLNWPDDCTVLDSQTFSESIRCGGANSPVRIRRMQIESVTPSQLSYTDLSIRSDVGKGSVYFLPLDTYGWVFPVVTGVNKTYELVWEAAGISAYTISYQLGRPEYLQETIAQSRIKDIVTMRFRPNRWDYDPYSFAVTYNGRRKLVPFNSTAPLSHRIGDGKYSNRTFDVVLSNIGTASSAATQFGVYTEAQLCPPKGCPVPPVPTIGTPMLWSRPSSWQNKKVPVGGQQVTIDSNMWIVMDISPPALGCITIYGKLSFLSNSSDPRSLILKTSCLKVFGTFEIMGQDNGSFVGDATVVLTGTKQNSLPVTMTEGVFLGSKVIGVSGSLRAVGATKNVTWAKLRTTAAAGSFVVDVAQVVTWQVGDTVLLSPTAFFTSSGTPWNSVSGAGPSDEQRTIVSLSSIVGNDGTMYSRLTLNRALNHTHICKAVEGFSFCGAIGVLSRNVRFLSADSQNPSSTSYGFGGHIHVFDITKTSPKRYGSINVTNVEFRNFGKINSDHYAIRVEHTDDLHPTSAVMNCSFTSGYSYALRVANTFGTRFEHNVVAGNFEGGVYIDALSDEFVVNGNMIAGTRQMPSVQSSSFPYLRPIAAFVVFSANGVISNNLAAGSHDQGFMVAMRLVTLPPAYQYLCALTRSLAANISVDDAFANRRFFSNEAVAGRGGVQIVTMGPFENAGTDCAAVDRAVAWRNAHTGVLALDVRPNIIVTNAMLAENHIGVVINLYKQTDDVYTGVVNSTIINSLGDAQQSCADAPDSVYLRGKHCAAFTENDPSGLSTNCGSIFSNIYRRVGVLMPMSTNRARTCAIERRFECDPPNTPDRLCLLPWEKRYALPNGIQYMEFHLHGNKFVGFQSRTYNSSSTLAGQCIPSQYRDRSVAVATNPSQVDYQPTVIASRNKWENVDDEARFGMDLGSFATICQYQPCSGQQMLIVHDQDGSFGVAGQKGQLVARNPELIDSYPSCYEVSNMALNLYFCPDTGSGSFQQYHGGWLDALPQIIQPLTTTRTFSEFNRTVASYGPIDDMCAKRFYFSRFNFLYATNRVNTIQSTGTTPSTIVMRWDAPDDSKATILHLVVEQSLKINVFIGDTSQGPWTAVSQNATYPTLTSSAGSSQRNPQKRYLAFTAIGHRFYRLVMVPVAAVTIRMEMSIAAFYSSTFIANMAMLLSIAPSRIKITSVREGSVITDFEVSPANEIAATSSDLVSQVSELTSVTTNLTRAIVSDAISSALNVTVLQVFATNPVVETELNATMDVESGSSSNSTFNITAYRAALISASTPQTVTLFTYPTSLPTSQPSRQPTSQPTRQPSRRPTAQPSCQPTGLPSAQPSSLPTSQPSRQPSRQPTSQPSSQPSSQPTHPTSRPTSQPSRQPSRQPTGQPTRQPTSQPTRQPTRQPTAQPSRQPFSRPTGQPSRQPTSQPTRQPFSRPTGQPTRQPSSQPTCQPTRGPTGQPTSQPTRQPSSQPSGQPTVRPTRQPSRQPTSEPSRQPTSQPSRQPFSHPSSLPSSQPSTQPSASPTASPSSRPSSKPTHKPTPHPTAAPTTASPSMEPTYVPTADPTYAPSGPTRVPTRVPTPIPSVEPTYSPSVDPTLTPTAVPSVDPTYVPTEIPTTEPTYSPSTVPSFVPSVTPSMEPTYQPSTEPTAIPSVMPSEVPTEDPSALPTEVPTLSPSPEPTRSPSAEPTVVPSFVPSAEPSVDPTPSPSAAPSQTPSELPSMQPTQDPSAIPSNAPTQVPSIDSTSPPSTSPSVDPTADPTVVPSANPTILPTFPPSYVPSSVPSELPSFTPSSEPSWTPSVIPTEQPSGLSVVDPVFPSQIPTTSPSADPTANPTPSPSAAPSPMPSADPSESPTVYPTVVPSTTPTAEPSNQPSKPPTVAPSYLPSVVPSEVPSLTPTAETETLSAIPSLIPTDAPTPSPSALPSPSPSVAPSPSPSVSPSEIPTVIPTVTPTIAPSHYPTTQPTSANPTLSPSRAPSPAPTVAPTSNVFKRLVFEASQTIDGVSSSSDATTEEAKAALGTLLAEQLSDSSRSVTVTVKSAALVTSRRLSNIEITSVTSLQVTYNIDVLLLSPGSLASTTVVLGMRDSLNSFVSSGAFSNALQNTGLSVFSSASSNSISVQTAFVETEVPAQPTAVPSTSDHSSILSNDQLAYVVVLASVGGLALLIVAFCFGRGYLLSKNARASGSTKTPKTVAIIPLQSDLTFIDIERLNTPDSAAAAAAGVMHTSEGDADVYVQRRVNSTRKLRGDTSQSKGRSFFDFEGVQGMFTRSPPSKRSFANDEEDSEASLDDYVDSIDEPDRESQPHIEQTNPIRALVAAQQRARRLSHGSSSASNDPVSGPLPGLQPVRPHESSLFFQDDSSSVDSDTPIVLRESTKKPVATAAHGSVVKVRPQKPDGSDSDYADNSEAFAVQTHVSSKPSPDKLPDPQSMASNSRDSAGSDWGVARVSEKDRFGRF